MAKKTMAFWLRTGIVATTAVAGCQHADVPRTAQLSPRQTYLVSQNPVPANKLAAPLPATPMAQMAAAPTATPAALEIPTQEGAMPTATPTPPEQTSPSATQLPEPDGMTAPPAPTLPQPEAAGKATAQSSEFGEQGAEVRQVRVQDPPADTMPPDMPPRRRSYVDTTANPCFQHSDDYRTLTGQLQHSHLSKTWRLRFASVDEADPFGGSVTLIDDDRLTDLKDGQYVRVRGHLLNPDERGIAPPYQIDSIQPLESTK